jgi:hypothetical protein
VGRDVVGGGENINESAERIWEVRRAAGRDFLARTTKTADGGGLGTYNSRSGRPRQGSQATTPPVASLLADPSSA